MDALTRLAIEASNEILRVVRDGVTVRHKADESPVTAADEASESVLLNGLARILPGLPVVSEESADTAPSLAAGVPFALVDPLDGTREFISGRDEYAVCIALIADGTPIVGILAAPALGLVWRGARGRGAERLGFDDGKSPVRISTRPWDTAAPKALVSRSHLDSDTSAWLARIPNISHEPCGSALKFCRLAEGAADVYPRLAPTCEWDMAAGDALVAAAGGSLTDPSGRPLTYGNRDRKYRIPQSIAWGDRNAVGRFCAP